MDREEVIKWLKIMKADLNSFPEVSSGKKIEALAEAIRLLKNEQSEEPSGSEKPNKSIEEKCLCYHCEYFEIKGWSHCKIHEDAYGDSRCNDYHKVSQDLTKVKQDLTKVKQDLTKVKQGSNKSEIPTSSTTKNDLGVEKAEVRKPCINYEDGCKEWAGCPCVHFKARK